jgi:pimeloyl-ACP methyl ester carboxylesterase
LPQVVADDVAMSDMTTHSLAVPGARLEYQVRGSGPVLMFIGHPMGSMGFAAITPLLADAYTVVTYDPRGFAPSTIDDPDQDAEPDLLADDVRRVLDAVGEGPADVMGSSGGAVTGMALATRHPGHVRTLVAHEPPVCLLLPDAEAQRAACQDIVDTYHREGIGAAWQRFAAFTGITMAPPDDARPGPPSPEMVAMSERFFAHGVLPITLYEPDLSALREGPVRVVVGGGTQSRGQFPHRTAEALADRLGTTLLEFPGGHTGFIDEASGFSGVLRRALG